MRRTDKIDRGGYRGRVFQGRLTRTKPCRLVVANEFLPPTLKSCRRHLQVGIQPFVLKIVAHAAREQLLLLNPLPASRVRHRN